MPHADLPAMPATELRERASALLAKREARERAAGAKVPTDAERQQTLHELQVHQIELELQNEELRRTQLELEASRRRWFELYDLAPVGYCTLSEAGLVLQANLAAAELLGRPRAELAKRRLSEFVERADQDSYYGLLAQLAGSGEPHCCELRMGPAQAHERWVQLTATAAAPDAQGVRTLRVVLVDVTARRQVAAAQAALRLSEQTHRNRSELLSRVSHEFRTPLNAILGFSHLLLGDASAQSPKARRQLEHIRDAGNHLLQMVNDLLEVSSASSGQLPLNVTAVPVLGALADAIRDVAAQAQAAGVSVRLVAQGASLAGVSADPTRLRQVMQNLLTNAIKYNRAGGHVDAHVTRHGPYWRVHIADNGLGMTQAQQTALFQPFNRLGRESSGIEGTGLGLVIARDLVQAMGGHLAVRSEPGVGTEILVDLPALDVAPDVAPGAPEAPADAGANVDANADADAVRADVTGRVLCVEADPASRELIRSLLERRPGLDVEIVQTGAACIAAARRAWPALLLLDMRLADMPGLDVLKVLRQWSPHLPMRCVVVSAEGAPADMAATRAAGIDDWLAKPLDPARLLATIDRLVGSRRQERP